MKRTLRRDGAQPFDDRCLSWQPDHGTVSIWTVAGRLKGVQFAAAEHQKALLAHRKGESDLLRRKGRRYLHATCEIPEAPQADPIGFLGVDLGSSTSPLSLTTNNTLATNSTRYATATGACAPSFSERARRAPSDCSASGAARKRGSQPTPTT